jgi:hypothetical protein
MDRWVKLGGDDHERQRHVTNDVSASGVSLKSHGRIGAQREFELKDGAKRRRLRRLPKAILDFKFSLRLRLAVRFKGRWLQSSNL